MTTCYRAIADRLYIPSSPVTHRDDEYHEDAFDTLLAMQERHFWYQGRHRFLLHAVQKAMGDHPGAYRAAVDLGGGCGGWIQYLQKHAPHRFEELALADSSLRALQMARELAHLDNPCYQVDLLRLGWQERWDVVFLLDVLEHIPEERQALEQIYQALRPGGLLFVTTPALNLFWSYNDEVAGHQRRYSRSDFSRLASGSGFNLVRSRYFMFFLSPLLLLARMRRPRIEEMTPAEIRAHQKASHQVPSALLNRTFGLIFGCETPLGHGCPFPWGTSVLAVMQKPYDRLAVSALSRLD